MAIYQKPLGLDTKKVSAFEALRAESGDARVASNTTVMKTWARRLALWSTAIAVALASLLLGAGSFGVANGAESTAARATDFRAKVSIVSAIQGNGGDSVCGTYFCTKFTVKVSCKLKACRTGRKVAILNKDPYGDDTWRIVWSGKTNANGTVTTPWINEDSWYYTYCCSSYPNPIKVRVAKKVVARHTFKGASWSGEVSYRSQDLS